MGKSAVVNILFALLLLAPALVFASQSSHGAAPAASGHKSAAPHWSYGGPEGPEFWGDLASSFKMCKNGRSQSPVNITSTLSAEVGGLGFHYSAAPLSILNNGHTIQVNYAKGSYLDIGGTQYDLLQFHFHSPSENKVNGSPFALEAHLVHMAKDGTLAVVGILFEESNQSHPILKGIWDNMPASAGPATTVSSIRVDANTMLPQNKSFYHFPGSLTTPPCSEGVKWYVMQGTFGVTRAQIDKFVSTVGHNARPTQPLNGRNLVSVGIGSGSGGGH